ncbi:MAG: DUF3467 domain-containing protein [Nitrospirota bacterium]
MSNQGTPTQVQVEVDETTAQGVYANMAIVAHTETEFVLDFVFIQPQAPKAKVRTRIITSPIHAKRFLSALQDNIRRYEDKLGTIKISGESGKTGDRYEGHYL